jgi:transcription-repair coupling factor (superfamily II helicase)
VCNLLALSSLRASCRRLGVAKLEAGPAAAAATLRVPPTTEPPRPLERRGERLVLPRRSRDGAERLHAGETLLELVQGALES